MSMEVEEFVSKFHNLDGNAIGDKKKSLFILLRKIPFDGDALIASLTPKTHLEKLFSLEVYLKLQKVPQLVAVLKSEDEYLTAKLLKNKWFCQRLAGILDENSAGFVDEVLPCMSFVTRQRLINKLAVYGTMLDSMFDDVYSRYGMHIASGLLLGCTEAKIKEVLANNDVTLSPFQQKLLFDKFPQLFLVYVKLKRPSNESVVSYVASKDIKTFIKLSEFNLRGSLGKRVTKKLLVHFKDLAIANAAKFNYFLHSKTVIKVLRDDFKQFYFECLPSSIGLCTPYMNLWKFSNKLGKRRYYKLLFEGIKTKYNKSLYDYPSLVPEELMEAMDVEDREKWIAIKKNHGSSENDLIKYLIISKAIPTIKSKINVTSSVGMREELVKLLVTICKINDDLDALSEVGEYVCTRHRNDDTSVLQEYLLMLKNSFDLRKLQERHWASITTLLKISELKTGTSWYLMEFYSAYLEFLFDTNKWKEEDVLKFLKIVKTSWSSYTIKNENLKKVILLKSIDFAPTLLGKDEKLKYCDLGLIEAIFEWNRQHPNDRLSISDYPRLTESLRESVNDAVNIDEHIDKLYTITSIVKHVICHGELPDLRNDLLAAYFLLGFRYFDVEIDFWLLKYQPEIISANFDKFLEHLISSYRADLKILHLLKKYSRFSFHEKTVKYCLEKFERSDSKRKLLLILAVLAPVEEFLQFVSPYYPTAAKIDENDEEKMKNGQISQDVASSFKYTTSSVVLATLLGYCKGDFLRYCLESMYYLFYHLPESNLSAFINDLSTKAVSARKHAIFLTCIVGTVDDVKKLFARFVESERNVSVRKHLFTAALKYFIRNPSDEFWETVKLCMANLNKHDNESFDMLVDLGRIPRKYQTSHVIFVWEILKKTDLHDKRRTLLSSIPSEVFKDLPLQFLLEVISYYFLKREGNCFEVTNDFVVLSLTKTNHSQEIMDKIFEIISKFKNVECDTLAKETKARETINCFTNRIVQRLQEAENADNLRQFSERWHNVFTVTNAMEEHLQISFALLYLESNKNISKFSAALGEFFNSIVSTFGTVIIDIFASVLEKSLQSFLECHYDYNEEYFKFCLTFLERKDLTFYLLVLKLLPNKEPEEDMAKDRFLAIVKSLRQVPQESIQVLLNIYIRNMESE